MSKILCEEQNRREFYQEILQKSGVRTEFTIAKGQKHQNDREKSNEINIFEKNSDNEIPSVYCLQFSEKLRHFAYRCGKSDDFSRDDRRYFRFSE